MFTLMNVNNNSLAPESKGSSPRIQQPSTFPYKKQDEFTLHSPIQTPQDPF
jgi:hypothetical protein